MKKIIIQLQLLIICVLVAKQGLSQGIIISDFSQIKAYFGTPGHDTFRVKADTKTIVLDINKIPKNKTDDFLKFSGITINGVYKSFATIPDQIVRTADKAKWLNDFNASGNFSYDIQNFLSDVKAGHSAILYVGIKAGDTAKQKIMLFVNKEVVKQPVSKTDSQKPPTSRRFIPNDSLELKWMSAYHFDALTPPILNKHTRWAVTYDYTKQDPVAVWKRTNKVSGTTCGDDLKMNTKQDKKSKNLEGIAKDIYTIDTMLNKLQASVTDMIAKQKLDLIRTDIESLKKGINANMTKEEQDKSFAKINELKSNLDIIKTLYPSLNRNPVAIKTNNINSNCCDDIYCATQSKRLAPTVARDLLISVTNYHPYRDSFTVSVAYNDQFTENGALFTSTFAALTNAAGTPLTTDTSLAIPKVQNNLTDSIEPKPLTYYDLFKILNEELKEYYNSKYQRANLDVREVENGVAYIKTKMTEILGITDFTEAGIAKRGEELADTIKKDTSISLNDYFNVVRQTAAAFSKVANYSRFDSKSILVQNKDVMDITLNRYRDGRLMTTTNEALRSYHTQGGFKIDFSLGLFGSSLIDKLYTTMSKETYDTSFFTASNGVVNRDSIVGIDTVQRKQIITDKRGNFDIGPAVFLHGYWRTGLDINIGGTFGLSINQSADIRYLYGVSLLFGKDSRWIVSIGGISGKIKDISSSYHENQIIDPITENNGSVPTKDVTKAGWFAAISWNFGGFTIGNNH